VLVGALQRLLNNIIVYVIRSGINSTRSLSPPKDGYCSERGYTPAGGNCAKG
jgi:hypothetical protein